MNYIAPAIFVFCLAGISWLAYLRYFKRIHLEFLKAGDIVSARDFAIFERDLNNLIVVIIWCDRMEEPSDLLYDSIKDNLGEKVKYMFFVARQNYEDAIGKPLQFFKNAERLKLGLRDDEEPTLTEVFDLGYNRNDIPYVFYVTRTPDLQLSVFSFRGDQKGVGVAKKYVFVGSDEARNMFHFMSRSFDALLKLQLESNFSADIKEGMLSLRGTREIAGNNKLRIVKE